MDLEGIIEALMISDTGTIQKATKELEQALLQPEAIVGICNIMAIQSKSENRQYAAVLLRKHLSKFQSYQQLPLATRQHLKSTILNIVLNEKDNIVRGSIVRFLGLILRHESQMDNDWVDEVMKFILNQCASTDAPLVEIGWFVFGKLADVSPKLFVQRFGTFGEIFQTALATINSGNSMNISPTVMYNILTVMSALVPKILRHPEAEKAFEMAVPQLVNLINKFAAERLMEHFTIALDILHNMSEYTPLLLAQHVQLLIEFAFAVSSNTTYHSEMRIKALNFICDIIGEKKKFLLKLKLVEPMLKALFDIIATEPESGDADEFFEETDIETPLAAATVVIDRMATKIPPEDFIPPLLSLLEPALNDNANELRRRAAYIVLATVCEGCREAMRDKNLKPMLNVLKQGLEDPIASVRNAALFAVGQFSEQLQPEIAYYANDILPLLLKNMGSILQAQQSGQQVSPKNSERVFYALEAFCESLEESLTLYIGDLMCMVLAMLSHNHSQRLKVLAMTLTEIAANGSEVSLFPWFHQLIDKLRPLLLQHEQRDTRFQAINTLAAIIRNIDKQFLPLASETMQQCVLWIESTDDIDLRKSLLNLFGALGSIVGENIAPILPTIVKHINRCMEESTEFASGLDRNSESSDLDDNEDEMELDEELHSSSETQFFGNNPYFDAQMQSIQTIHELAESCMQALLSFAENLLKTLCKMIDHTSDDIRVCSMAATKTFIIKWIQTSPDDSAKQALFIYLFKLRDIIRKHTQIDVVIEALESLYEVLWELGTIALQNKEISDSIVQCIKEGLTNEYNCLFSKQCESHTFVIEDAARLLISLGRSVGPDEFAEYFQFLEPYIVGLVHNAHEGEKKFERSLINVLADCYALLGKNIAPYFVKHLNMMIHASKQMNSLTPENALFWLGELILFGKEMSYSYFPAVLEHLSQNFVSEKEPAVINNVVGVLARLIITNATLVPLHEAIPVMLQKLPIIDDMKESIVVIECFDLLCKKTPESIQPYTETIVASAMQSIAESSCDQILLQQLLKLLQKVSLVFPADYQLAMANPELAPLISIARERADGQL